MVNHDALDYDQVHHRDDDIDVSDGGNDELDNEQLQNTIMEKAPPSEKYKIIVCCIWTNLITYCYFDLIF